MKTIKIKTDFSTKGKHIVNVNGVFHTFPSSREMNKFIARLNSKAKEWIIELNELYIQCLVEYRRAWFLMWSYKGHYARSENTCHSHLNAIEDRLNHLTRSKQGGFIVFVDIKKICLFMIIVCHELEKFHSEKNNTMNKHIIAIVRKRIDYILNELQNYKPLEGI